MKLCACCNPPKVVGKAKYGEKVPQDVIVVANDTETFACCERQVVCAEVLENAGLVWMSDGHGGKWHTPDGSPVQGQYNISGRQKR